MKPQEIIGELLPDNDQFRLALPVGSTWMALFHPTRQSSGPFMVAEHRRECIRLKRVADEAKQDLNYPFVNEWKIERGHIRMGTAEHGLLLTLAPA